MFTGERRHPPQSTSPLMTFSDLEMFDTELATLIVIIVARTKVVWQKAE